MIKLVSCIEKYPAIYDTSKHYSKDEQDRSWDKVALEVGEKGKSIKSKLLIYQILGTSHNQTNTIEYLAKSTALELGN